MYKIHPNARTTPVIRAAIATSAEPTSVLARRYGMHGLFIAGLVWFGLYVWRNAASLVPPDPARDLGHGPGQEDAVAGQSAASGLEALLRRGVSQRQALEHCFETWEGTPPASNLIPPERRKQARAALSSLSDARNVREGYRKLRDIIHPPRQ